MYCLSHAAWPVQLVTYPDRWISVRRHRSVFYRVRGVGSSCAQHLTVESYTVVTLLTFILIIISIPSPVTLSYTRLKTFLFCKFKIQTSWQTSVAYFIVVTDRLLLAHSAKFCRRHFCEFFCDGYTRRHALSAATTFCVASIAG